MFQYHCLWSTIPEWTKEKKQESKKENKKSYIYLAIIQFLIMFIAVAGTGRWSRVQQSGN